MPVRRLAAMVLHFFIACLIGNGAVIAPAYAQSTPATATLVGVLPGRADAAPALRARLDRVARGLGLVGAAPTFALSPTVQRAEAQAAGGRLDEAAALLDIALDEGVRAPLQVIDPAALVRAAVARATIGLARGERDRAESLLGQLMRYDPTFQLAPREDTPRVRAAVVEVRRELGPAPELQPADLGERCRDQTILLARSLGGGNAEYARYFACRRVAWIRAGDDATDTRLIAALQDPDRPSPLASSSQPAGPLPGDKRAPAPIEGTPFYKSGWFWGITAGVVAAAAGAGIWAATRDTGAAPGDGWHVTTHF